MQHLNQRVKFLHDSTYKSQPQLSAIMMMQWLTCMVLVQVTLIRNLFIEIFSELHSTGKPEVVSHGAYMYDVFTDKSRDMMFDFAAENYLLKYNMDVSCNS